MVEKSYKIIRSSQKINILFMFEEARTTPKNPISADIWGGPFFFFFRV